MTARDSAPNADRPAASQKAAKRPAAEQQAADRPGADRSAPAAAQPAAAQPAAVQPAANQKAVQRPAYEQARDQLAELVKRLEAGGLTLEQSLELWERGERLAAICEEWLEGARARLAGAMARPADDDGPAAAPF